MNTDIINYIKTLSNNEKVQDLLILTLGKILLESQKLKNNQNKINHIRDWISSVVENNEKWKNPRVLTIEALNNAADKYFEKKNNQLQTIKLNKKDEKLIADLGEYYVVQMLTPQALDNESKQMQHCIGHGSYDERLKNKNYKYLSLRDKFNKAHVTLEIENFEVLQLQGKQNKIPDKKYLGILSHWLIESKYEIDLDNSDLFINKLDNQIYSIYGMPDNCEIDGDLRIDLNVKKIPKNLKVNGTVYFLNKKFNLKILADDHFKDDQIDIYDLLSFLIQNGYEIDLKNRYDLVFNKLDNKIYSIYNLPDNCEIDGNLFLRNIEKLPNNLVINGNLNILNSNIEEIPKNLTVYGDLDIKHCYKIKQINKDINIQGDFLMSSINIKYKEIPDELFVEDNIDMLTLSKYLYNKKILIDFEKFNLFLDNQGNICKIDDLPEYSIINHSIQLNESNYIKKIPNNLTINGNLVINDCSNLEKLPENLIIKSNLDLFTSYIKEIPNSIKIGKCLDISKSINIEKIPNNLEITALFINKEQIDLIKETMEFDFIYIDYNKLTRENFFKEKINHYSF